MRTSDDLETTDSGAHGLSRRSVIKAGAHAAWIVPTVQVVSMAPAIANSTTPGSCDPQQALQVTVTTDTPQWEYKSSGNSGNWVLALHFKVCDIGCTQSFVGLEISITETGFGRLDDHSTVGWTQSRQKLPGHSNTDNKTYTNNSFVVPPGSTACKFFTIYLQGDKGEQQAGKLEITVTSKLMGASTPTIVAVPDVIIKKNP